MSGLFGYAGKEARGPEACAEIAAAMGAAMLHTPRQQFTVSAAGDRLACGHLGIGILNRAPQPLVHAGRGVSLWMCGEFYHHAARKRDLARAGLLPAQASDAELALAVYLEHGIEQIAATEGAFVVAIWDASLATLLIVTDRFGLYPHYYTKTDAGFAFAPELKGLRHAPGFVTQLDPTALAQYIRFQLHLGERTWLAGVSLLPQASIVRYRPHEDVLELEKYWDWDQIRPTTGIDLPTATREATRLFKRAVDAMSPPGERVGVYLSGGLDGRTILAHLDHPEQVTTVTFGAPDCRDVIYGREIARRAHSPNLYFELSNGQWVIDNHPLHLNLTEGMHSFIHMHGISTLPEASQRMDVHLSGWDGGTVLGARISEYGAADAKYRHAPSELEQRERLYAGFCQDFTWPGLTDAEADAVFLAETPLGPGKELAALARSSFDAEFARTARYPQPYRADYFYQLHHVRRSTQQMVVFQRSAFEVRCPYFDYGLVDFLYSLPEPIYAAPDVQRGVLTHGSSRLAMVPNERDEELPHANPAVRLQHRLRRKAGRLLYRMTGMGAAPGTRVYADYENYLRTDLRAWSEGFLFGERFKSRGYFRTATIDALWHRHLAGNEPWTMGKIAPFIAVEHVMQVFDD